MPIIFEQSQPGGKQNRGRAVVLEQDDAIAGSILDVEGWDGFAELKAIFTQVQIVEQTNHQFLHTLGDRIYLYVFGDRIGTLGLTGLAFYDNCSEDEVIGVAHVLDYYRTRRLSRRASPLRITIDPSTVFEAYLHTFNANVVNTAQRLYQFNLTLALLPDSAEDAEPDLVLGGEPPTEEPLVDGPPAESPGVGVIL